MMNLREFSTNLQEFLTSRGYEAGGGPEELMLLVERAISSQDTLKSLIVNCPRCGSEHIGRAPKRYELILGSPACRIPVNETVVYCTACRFETGALPADIVREAAILRFAKEQGHVSLWLDDIRKAPVGWVHAKTVAEAQQYLEQDTVFRASLDHDLGDDEEYGTGYKLVCWMEETGHWPRIPPEVHSANPVGKKKMLTAINRHYNR